MQPFVCKFILVQRSIAVTHAVGNVDKQRAAEVGVLLELLDIQAVLPRPDFPVHVAQVLGHELEVGLMAQVAQAPQLLPSPGPPCVLWSVRP